MKIFDCFPFFNELDLLELRMKLLDKVVDYFVIAESNLTHSGEKKPYYFEDAKERFSPWRHKIIYLPIVQVKEGLEFTDQDQYNPQSAEWKLENGQRNALINAATHMNDEDLVLLSDLDEIPNPDLVKKARTLDKPIAFSLLLHYYYLNCQSSGDTRWWKGCIAATARQFKEITPQGLRDQRDEYPCLPNAGWHFSYLGGAEKIRQKLQSYAHSEYKKEQFLDEDHIRNAMLQGKDVLGRNDFYFTNMPLSYYPGKMQKLMKQYPELLYLKKHFIFQDLYFTTRRILKGMY